MDARQRFLQTMHHGQPDHVPYVDQTIRQDTLDRWRRYVPYENYRVYRELIRRLAELG